MSTRLVNNPCSPIPLYWTTIVLVDAPFTSPKTFHTLPRIEPPGSFSIVDRVLDHVEPQVKSPSVPLEKHSESHAQQHTESISDKDDDDDDMWMSVSYDNVPDDKMPLTWESHVPGTRFLTEMPPEYYESIYQRWDSLVAIVLHYANSHLLSQLCATSIFIDSRRAIGRGIKMRIRLCDVETDSFRNSVLSKHCVANHPSVSGGIWIWIYSNLVQRTCEYLASAHQHLISKEDES